jgi:hypothetical protein
MVSLLQCIATCPLDSSEQYHGFVRAVLVRALPNLHSQDVMAQHSLSYRVGWVHIGRQNPNGIEAYIVLRNVVQNR